MIAWAYNCVAEFICPLHRCSTDRRGRFYVCDHASSVIAMPVYDTPRQLFHTQTDADGGQIPVGRKGVGDSFGELALIYNAPRSATVVAVGNCKVRVLSRGLFSHIVRSNTQSRKAVSMFWSLGKTALHAPRPALGPNVRVVHVCFSLCLCRSFREEQVLLHAEWLKKLELLAPLTNHERIRLVEAMQVVAVEKGQVGVFFPVCALDPQE